MLQMKIFRGLLTVTGLDWDKGLGDDDIYTKVQAIQVKAAKISGR